MERSSMSIYDTRKSILWFASALVLISVLTFCRVVSIFLRFSLPCSCMYRFEDVFSKPDLYRFALFFNSLVTVWASLRAPHKDLYNCMRARERKRERERERERGREREREIERERERFRQSVCSSIHASQQLTSPIGFLSLKLPPPPCAVLLVIPADATACQATIKNPAWEEVRIGASPSRPSKGLPASESARFNLL